MEIKSVNNSRQPNYPTIELFIKHPELLSRNIPNSWLKNKFVSTSLAAFLLYGGGTSVAQESEETNVVNTIKDSNSDTKKPQKKKEDVTNIAPVFAHGEGNGSIGCIVVAPPVFLSEDEAIKIILDKLRAEGYNFSTENCPAMSFKVLPLADEWSKGKTKVKLKMDAYNSNAKWVIQFISTGDISKFKNDNYRSSLSRYETKKAAEIINQALKEQQETNAVVFYDPLTRIDLSARIEFQENLQKTKKESKDLLLAQVEDFIKWLKTNNIAIQ